jgi:hypothetical protein
MTTPIRNPNDPPNPAEVRPIPTEQHPAGQEVNRDNPVPQPPLEAAPPEPVEPPIKPPPDGGPPTGGPPPATPSKKK